MANNLSFLFPILYCTDTRFYSTFSITSSADRFIRLWISQTLYHIAPWIYHILQTYEYVGGMFLFIEREKILKTS
jgi:hypothetical protein